MKLNIEDVAPEWVSDEIKIEAEHQIRRVNIGGQRFYWLSGQEEIKLLPSVTTFLNKHIPKSKYLLEWMKKNGMESDVIRDRKALYGTAMHVIIEHFLKNKFCITAGELTDIAVGIMSDPSDYELKELKRDILGFSQFCIDVQLEPVAIEMPLYSEKMGLTGTADLPCRITIKNSRINAKIDFKSGRKGFFETHKYQLHLYRDMWNERYGEVFPIKRVFNWSPSDWKTKPAYKFEEQTCDLIDKKLRLYLQLEKLDPIKATKSVLIFEGIQFGQPKYQKVDIVSYLKSINQ